MNGKANECQCKAVLNSYRKTKTKVITPTNHKKTYTIQWTNQKSKQMYATGAKRGKTRASEARLVLLCIG